MQPITTAGSSTGSASVEKKENICIQNVSHVKKNPSVYSSPSIMALSDAERKAIYK